MSDNTIFGLLISMSSIFIILGILIAFLISDIFGIIIFISGLGLSSLSIEYI